MRRMRNQGFFELTWTIFRFAMKAIFAVLCVLYLFAGAMIFLLSPDLGTVPAHQFVVSVASALLFGLVFVSYLTLLLAVPVSAFCALAAFAATGVMRLYGQPAGDPVPMWQTELEPGALEVIGTHIDLKDATCPVCASKLDPVAEYVSCLRCESAHHAECWTYVGTCATFGCGSDRARVSSQPAPEGTPEWNSWKERWCSRSERTPVKPS